MSVLFRTRSGSADNQQTSPGTEIHDLFSMGGDGSHHGKPALSRHFIKRTMSIKHVSFRLEFALAPGPSIRKRLVVSGGSFRKAKLAGFVFNNHRSGIDLEIAFGF